jgi:hypothetical protein
MNLDNKIIDINTLSLQNSVYKDVVLTAEELGILQDMANEYESIPTTKYLNSLSEKLYNGEVARPEVI